MNVTQKGIITLLKSAVTGESLPLPEGFDLEVAYPMLKRHHMATMIYDGALRCGLDRQNPVMKKLFQSYCKALMVSEGQMREIERIFSAFDENGIDYMPLKGCRMKSLYPKPELRMMGDADILIRLEQLDRIELIMEKQGFQAGKETDHELVYQSPSLYLELHKRLIPSYNVDFHAYFGDGWRLAKQKDGARYSMTAEDELIYLFTHFAKHYRDGGIGCRHVVDLWVYLRSQPGLDEDYVKAELDKLRLLEFYSNIRRLMAVWFEDALADNKMEYLTDFIFASGSWGDMQTRLLSLAVRDAEGTLDSSGKLHYLRAKLFPGVVVLKDKYTVLQKAPWLLPAVWVVRPFYKFLCERDSLEQRRREMDLLSADGVEERHRLLNYVGLDYNF